MEYQPVDGGVGQVAQRGVVAQSRRGEFDAQGFDVGVVDRLHVAA
ncbi:Uncharacterised protein [Mycobacteroides abscessus subsp. abscessus]|nr:Uncharacterised protein [Mycobacteroides abscessus subsp. abscessus]